MTSRSALEPTSNRKRRRLKALGYEHSPLIPLDRREVDSKKFQLCEVIPFSANEYEDDLPHGSFRLMAMVFSSLNSM